MERPRVCAECGEQIQEHHFGYKRSILGEPELCWECFKDEFKDILTQIEFTQPPSVLPLFTLSERMKHIALLNWIMGLVAEKYGEEW